MRSKLWIFLALFLVIPVLLGTVSCAKKDRHQRRTEAGNGSGPGPAATAAPSG
jgi:hypothetical protein